MNDVQNIANICNYMNAKDLLRLSEDLDIVSMLTEEDATQVVNNLLAKNHKTDASSLLYHIDSATLLEEVMTRELDVLDTMGYEDVCEALGKQNLLNVAHYLVFHMPDILKELKHCLDFYQNNTHSSVNVVRGQPTEMDKAKDIIDEIPISQRIEKNLNDFYSQHSPETIKSKVYTQPKTYHRWDTFEENVIKDSIGLTIFEVSQRLAIRGVYPTDNAIIGRAYKLGLHVRRGVICAN